ncbi:Indoleamine 2,3-dioxygenase [Podospora didyma]|uniref:Indoleamine 2,3-dioxygenase n=1 Tax=Podospora didyma TaxID=330526 RepID=A0AAE0KDR6_9PEZI|nr:Indoleamine 2,3-dioxygenase [Podospora didyma]
MSPCEVLPFQSEDAAFHGRLLALFAEFAITSHGFLPEETPLERLPDPYYAPWECLIRRLPASIEAHTIRAEIDALPMLSADRLSTVAEWRRACVILAFIAHGYIWGGDHPSEILPPVITVPLLRVCSRLGLPPVATFASLNLWNFRSASPTLGFSSLDTIHALHTITGTEDESWFLMVSVAIEAQGAYIIPVMLHALEAIQQDDYPTVTRALNEMSRCIGKIAALLERMYEKCNPGVFYHRVRTLLAGSWNMAAAGLPRGVFYDEGNGNGQWRQLRGGSNGQSSLIQFIDIVLGVQHSSCGNSRPEKVTAAGQSRSANCSAGAAAAGFHEEVREYMPEAHRRFLEHVSRILPGGIRKVVADMHLAAAENGITSDQLEMQNAFQGTIKALAGLRNKHLQIVARYIIIPARQPNDAVTKRVNLATASSSKRTCPMAAAGGQLAELELTGTGGTALLPFLKQTRDETLIAGAIFF